MSDLVKRLACATCGASLQVGPIDRVVTCEFCRASNYLAFDLQGQSLALARELLDRRQMLAGVRRKLEVVGANLKSVDPGAFWSGPPQLSWGKDPALLAAGALALVVGLTSGWAALSILGLVLVVVLGIRLGRKVSRYNDLRALYLRDLHVSQANAELAQELWEEHRFLRSLLARLEGEDATPTGTSGDATRGYGSPRFSA